MAQRGHGWCEFPKHLYRSRFPDPIEPPPRQPLAAASPPYPRRGAEFPLQVLTPGEQNYHLKRESQRQPELEIDQ